MLPLVRGYARIEGSKMAGRDFVAQSATAAAPDANPREVLQQKLMAKVVPACEELGVVVESITVGQSEKDADLEALATQISDREQARLEREKNASLIDQYKQAQELAATTARKEQNEEKVAATTKLNMAKIEAEQKLEVEQTETGTGPEKREDEPQRGQGAGGGGVGPGRGRRRSHHQGERGQGGRPADGGGGL